MVEEEFISSHKLTGEGKAREVGWPQGSPDHPLLHLGTRQGEKERPHSGYRHPEGRPLTSFWGTVDLGGVTLPWSQWEGSPRSPLLLQLLDMHIIPVRNKT